MEELEWCYPSLPCTKNILLVCTLTSPVLHFKISVILGFLELVVQDSDQADGYFVVNDENILESGGLRHF